MSFARKPPNQEVKGYHNKHLISPCDMIFRQLKRWQGASLRPTLTLPFIALFYRSFRKYPSAEMIYPTVVYLMQATQNASLNPIAAHSKIALRILGEVRSVNFSFSLPFLAFCCELPDTRLRHSRQESQRLISSLNKQQINKQIRQCCHIN